MRIISARERHLRGSTLRQIAKAGDLEKRGGCVRGRYRERTALNWESSPEIMYGKKAGEKLASGCGVCVLEHGEIGREMKIYAVS